MLPSEMLPCTAVVDYWLTDCRRILVRRGWYAARARRGLRVTSINHTYTLSTHTPHLRPSPDDCIVHLHLQPTVVAAHGSIFTARTCACLCLCPSVTSRSSIETDERIELMVLAWELPSTYPTLCCKQILVPQKIRVLPSGTSSKLATASRCVVDCSYDGRGVVTGRSWFITRMGRL